MSKPAWIDPDVAAHDPRELDVADLAVRHVGPVDPVFLNGDDLQPEVTGHTGHLARVVRLDPADRHQRVAALGESVGDEVLELANLVAAEGDAAVAVFALGPDLDLATERRREAGSGCTGEGPNIRLTRA